MKWVNGNYWLTDDNTDIDIGTVHKFLSEESYWSKGIPLELLSISLSNSLCFSLHTGSLQVGFARIISDYATIAYLGDVFILNDYRGNGLSKWMMDCIVDHPKLQGLRRWILATSNAHGLYSKYKFTPLVRPEIFMERLDTSVYQKQ